MSYYGKYRGKVVNNVDPMMLGRIIPLVPAVSEFPLGWALPCTPYAGPQVGFFALPPVSANVWIEFEEGDPNHPIWSGAFWGDGEVPAQPAVPTTKVLKTETMSLEMNNLTSELKLELTTPSGQFSLVQNASGIELSSNAVTIKIGLDQIELTNGPSQITVSPEGVTAASAGASSEVTPDSVSLKNGGASVDIAPASISLKNGAASVDLSPSSVSLNNGALEVT